VLRVVIDTDGCVRDIRVVQSLDKELDEQAAKAARCRKYEPGKRDGLPVFVEIDIEHFFRQPK
jgi:TonB family protein